MFTPAHKSLEMRSDFSAELSGNGEVPPHSTEVASVSQMVFGKSTKLVRGGERSQLLARGTWVK